jgi:hypothetical protein
MKMEDDKPEYSGFFTRWLKPGNKTKEESWIQDELARQRLYDEVERNSIKASIAQGMSMYKLMNGSAPRAFHLPSIDEVCEEVRPEPIDMTQYIHKDEMVQILLDSRHALFTDRIPSVLEVIEWIEERKKKQIM